MGDQFGRAVDTRSGTVVVGAPQAEVNGKPGAGAAYVYERTPSGTRQVRLTAPFPGVRDTFSATAISGDTVIVGARYDDRPTGNDTGSAFVVVRSGNAWVQQATLTAPDGVRFDGFGTVVAIDGDTAVIGASIVASDGGGANPTITYVFQRTAGAWAFQ